MAQTWWLRKWGFDIKNGMAQIKVRRDYQRRHFVIITVTRHLVTCFLTILGHKTLEIVILTTYNVKSQFLSTVRYHYPPSP